MTHVAGVIVRAPVSHIADLKPVAGSPAAGAMGKAWVLEGKCHLFHSVGSMKHADYSVRSDQRSFCKRPSVAL